MSGPGGSEYRDRLLDAAAEIIAAHGIEGLTAGKLATHVGLKRTVVHYHFGTMDHLLAALLRRSSAEIRKSIARRFNLATLGRDIWAEYTVSIPAAEGIRARALVSQVVGEAYRESLEDLRVLISGMLQQSYRLRGIEPEIPTDVMALVILMSAQFVGAQRVLGSSDSIAALESYMKSLFAVTAGNRHKEPPPR